MGFIGVQPASVPLTASDITNDIINADKIADNSISEEHLDPTVITGLSALGSEPADTDEFLVSDAGTLKRMDYSYIKGGGTHTLLETINISSGTGNVDTSAFFSTTYKIYRIYGRMVRPQNNATNLRFRFIESDGTVKDASNYKYQEVVSLDSGLGRNNSSGQTYVQMNNTISNSVDNGACNFSIVFNTDLSTSSDNVLQYYWQGGGASGGSAIYFSGGGWYDAVISNDPPSKIRFFFDSGNVASGKFSIFGITGAI